MTVDISKVFKANVKAIRMSQGETTGDALNEQLLGKTVTKKKKEETVDFGKTAKNIVANITMLKNFLNENKKLYLQPDYLISGEDGESAMSSEWQKFEDDAESIIRKCAEMIRQLREAKLRHQKYTSQQREHLDNVFYLLDKYLKDVCKLYSEQKAIRVRRIVEKKNYSTLSTDLVKSIKLDEPSSRPEVYVEELEKEKSGYVNFENELSAEELQAFEQENEKLFEELSVDTEEIKKIESQVIEVSKLTQIFAEKIVSQSATIEHIQKTAVDINSDLSLGNENVKEAMKKNASFRLWILFIIIVLSLTLLFLDWYND